MICTFSKNTSLYKCSLQAHWSSTISTYLPQLERSESSTQWNSPVTVVNGWIRISMFQIQRIHDQGWCEADPISHPQRGAVEICEKPLVGICVEWISIFDALLRPIGTISNPACRLTTFECVWEKKNDHETKQVWNTFLFSWTSCRVRDLPSAMASVPGK